MQTYDVVICGGGLAGLTLARQIKLSQPERTIAVIDRMKRPLPIAKHKVGESTVEVGACYLGEKLQLVDYFDREHYPKLGLRYFFGDTRGPFHERPEFGLSHYPGVESYQIDRGAFENDLRQINIDAGITLIEGMSIKDIVLSEDDLPHTIQIHDQQRTEHQTIQTRWVVDAMGRRRYLQKKLNLTKNQRGHCSAAWFRLEGRIDVNGLTATEYSDWHNRVPDGNRYYSTNHLMGDGYWVWLIPLSSSHTSIGIVTDETIHPFETYHRYDKAMNWLQTHEPVLASHIQDCPPLDFKCMRHYSHSSKQVFSTQRWSCVGEAGVFVDPYYSPGTDMIGFANTMTTAMIQQDFEETLSDETVTHYNQFLIGLNDALTQSIQSGYPSFGQETIMAARLLWDFTAAWSLNCAYMFNDSYLDPANHRKLNKVTAGFYPLRQQMIRLFATWSQTTRGRLSYEFFDYLSLDFLADLRLRNLQTNKTVDELIADQEANMMVIEELAQVLFLIAVEDTMPDKLADMPDPLWLHAWGVDLNSETWEKRLFQPITPPRDLSAIYNKVREKFTQTVTTE
ncbi:MAG: tryptophan 7-halogenase [Chloroflexota bacterium]